MADSVVKLTCGYEDTDFSRQYEFGVADSLVGDVKDNVIAINDSLAASNSGGMHSFFLSDDGHNLKAITNAKVVTIEEFPIPINQNGGE